MQDDTDPVTPEGGGAEAPTATPTLEPPVETSPEQLHQLIESGDTAAFAAWFEACENTEALRLLAQLSAEDRERILAALDPETARWVVEYTPEPQALKALEEMAPESAARILEELPSDEQADVLGDLEPDRAEAILAEYEEREDAEEVRRL